MPAAWATVAKLGLVLAILTVVILVVRRIFSRVEERQALADTVERLKRERAEDAKKLKAALGAEEIRREAKRDSVTGLPFGVQPRQKSNDGPVGQPPAG